MKNSDGQRPNKRSERQTEIAGKRPYHRVPKLQKAHQKQADNPINKGYINEQIAKNVHHETGEYLR